MHQSQQLTQHHVIADSMQVFTVPLVSHQNSHCARMTYLSAHNVNIAWTHSLLCMMTVTIRTCVQTATLLLQVPGLVNVDFADVRAIMTGAGSSLMGQGRASGKARARDAALAAISSPLLDVGIERATGIVWNITGPADLTLFEVTPSSQTH